MFDINWPHRASSSSFNSNKTSTNSRKPFGSISIENRQYQNVPNNCSNLHKAPELKSIHVHDRKKFNKKTPTNNKENNISSISNFVKASFEDKMNYMQQIENKDRNLAARKLDPTIIERKQILNQQNQLHKLIFGDKETNKPTSEHQSFELDKWGKHAALLPLYEKTKDNQIKNENKRTGHPLFQINLNYHNQKYQEAHENAKKYLTICQDDEMEMAYRQNVITLRALGNESETQGRRCKMELEEAKGTSYLSNNLSGPRNRKTFRYFKLDDVVEPKIKRDETLVRIKNNRGNNKQICERCGLNRNLSSSYCDVNHPYLSAPIGSNRTKKTEEIEKRRRKSSTSTAVVMTSKMKRKETRQVRKKWKQTQEKLSAERRSVVQSVKRM